MRTRHRIVTGFAVLLVTAGLATWWWLRPIRWNDASTPPPPLASALEAFKRGEVDSGLRLTRRALREYDAPAWESRARLACAARCADAGRRDAVLTVLPDPLPADDPLAAHADLLRARAALAAGRAADAARAAIRAADAAGFPHRDEALRTRSEAVLATDGPAAASAILDAGDDPDLAIESARLAAQAGRLPDARRKLATALFEAPPGEAAERILDTLQRIVAVPAARFAPEERSQLLASARAWIDARRYAAALSLLRAARSASVDPTAAALEAETLIRLGRVAESAALLARARTGDPATQDAARYWQSRVDNARGRRAASVAGLNELARRPGRSAGRLEALLDLAEIADGVPTPKALAAYARYRVAAGDVADPVALFREGFIAHELSKPREADAAFARVLARADAPMGARAAALYWTGKRAATTGSRAMAERSWREILDRYPAHYYAGVAERSLRLAPPSPAKEPVAPVNAASAGAGRRWLEAARALRSVGLTAWAWPAYRAAIATSESQVARAIGLEAAAAAVENEAPAEALSFIAQTFGERETVAPSALPRSLWRLLVPAPAGPDIAQAARAQGLEPALVAAIALEESAFNPLAVSPVGARGLLQVMPATAAEFARKLGMRGFADDRLFEPAVNLRIGTAYFRALRDRVGSLPAALAAYNAGPARAERWRRANDDATGESFVERIPIPATRLYVKRILGNQRLYRMTWPAGLEPEPAP